MEAPGVFSPGGYHQCRGLAQCPQSRDISRGGPLADGHLGGMVADAGPLYLPAEHRMAVKQRNEAF